MPAPRCALLVVERGVRCEGVSSDAASDVPDDGVDLGVCHLVRCAGDVAGAPYQMTDAEVDAVIRYVAGGVRRHALATYAAFYHEEGAPGRRHVYDNRRLAPLFGLDPAAAYTTRRLNAPPVYTPCADAPLLWRGIGAAYASLGYASTQIPADAARWVEGGAVAGAAGRVDVLAQTPFVPRKLTPGTGCARSSGTAGRATRRSSSRTCRSTTPSRAGLSTASSSTTASSTSRRRVRRRRSVRCAWTPLSGVESLRASFRQRFGRCTRVLRGLGGVLSDGLFVVFWGRPVSG